MSAPDFNDPAWIEANLPKPWLTLWTVKRRFTAGAPKSGYSLESLAGRAVTITVKYGFPAWPGEPFATARVIHQLADGSWGQKTVDAKLPAASPARDLSLTIDASQFVQPGNWFGVVLRATGGHVRSDILALRMPEQELPDPDPAPDPDPDPDPPNSETRGAAWPCFADGRAPVLASTPTAEQPAAVWEKWRGVSRPQLVSMGVDGTHTPLDGSVTLDFAAVYADNSDDELVTACWCVFEGRGGPADALRVVRELVALYDERPNPGWLIVGPTWDVWQAPGWESTGTVNEWIALARAIVGDRRILIGARARRNPETGAAEQRYAGDYVAFEAHVESGAAADAVFTGAIRQAHGRPVAEFDRFRVRSGGEGKDMTDADMPLVCRASRARRVAIIIGHSSDTGAWPFARAEQIREALDPDNGGSGEIVEPADPEVPDPPLPPDCADQVRTARQADAAVLDAIERRLRAEVIGPFDRLGLWAKFTQGPGLLKKAEEIIGQDYRPLVAAMKGER